MTTRASRANLTPKANASAKTSPKGAKPTPQTPSKAPSKAPAKASKPTAPSATKAPTASQPAKVTAASVSAKLDAAKPSGPLGLTPADIRTAQTDPRNQRPTKGLTIPSEADVQAAAQNAHTPLIAVKRMSAEERRYAKRRVEDIVSANNVAFKRERDALSRWGLQNHLYATEVAAGRYTVDLKKIAKSDGNTQLSDVVILTNYPQGLGKYIQSRYDDLDARQEQMKQMGARLLDEIMLGSPADAIERIQRFENTEF